MKGIIRIIALVALIAVLGMALVACFPGKGMDAAKAGWKKILSDRLSVNYTNIKLHSVDFKQYDNLNEKTSNCYMFKFVLSYTDNNGKNKDNVVLFANAAPYNGSYVVNVFRDSTSYDNLEKKTDYIKVTKDGDLSKSQIKDLMAYYEENKGSIWKSAPVEEEENVVD